MFAEGMEKALVHKEYPLEKFPGKGGWTYARIPEIAQDKKSPFGWVKVRGWIDNYEIKNYKLMPMGNGKLFLPIKASIRKKIGKQAGDKVEITLYPDNSPIVIPNELKLCLVDIPNAYEQFCNLSEGEKKTAIDWIYSAKKDETKTDRILTLIERLQMSSK
ncbi:MAG TPA: YdeI/OmpD-associated family protein [Chitinophagaceae bacterium]|nr:YdeI/OmpD-associated family protein [Chitinophagaceae bacterium]